MLPKSLSLRCRDIIRLDSGTNISLTLLKSSLVKTPVTQLFLSNLPGPTCWHRAHSTNTVWIPAEKKRGGTPQTNKTKQQKQKVCWVSAPGCDSFLCGHNSMTAAIEARWSAICRCAFPLLNEEKQTRGLAWSSCWGRNRSQHAAINESLVRGWVGGGRGGTQPLPNTEILSERSTCVYSISSLFSPLRLSSSYKLTRPALGEVTSTVKKKKKWKHH